ncbi:hypothetical protein Tco_0880225 [Tanacetum coccineum]
MLNYNMTLKNATRHFQKSLIGKILKAVTTYLIFPTPSLLVISVENVKEYHLNTSSTMISRDDVANFAIALRIFTRSLVIQKRVKDLQLGVKSYQKHINVTKPDTTRPDLRKRHPYTPYKDPQGFIYFSDGTLTRLLSSLEDITKNINMEYLPKRRWSTLEKKRAHFMIKDINKLLKERRMMRSLEKFVGGRLYGTDLRLLQKNNMTCVALMVKKRFDTSARNPVKIFFLKLNLPDPKSISAYSKVTPTKTQAK